MTEYLSSDKDDSIWRSSLQPIEEFLRTERELSAFSHASESLESMRWLGVLEQEFQLADERYGSGLLKQARDK